MNKSFDQVKSTLSKSLWKSLFTENTPPPDELRIPYASLEADEDEENTARARVTYIVHCPDRKVHTVHVKFKYNPQTGSFIRSSMQYV